MQSSQRHQKKGQTGGTEPRSRKLLTKSSLPFEHIAQLRKFLKKYFACTQCLLKCSAVFENNIKNQGDWEGTQGDINSIEILVQVQSEIKNRKSMYTEEDTSDRSCRT